MAFHEPLADAILSYLLDEDIASHSELLNLKSSQAACLNFIFPLRQDPDLAKAVLRRFLPGLREVTGIEFEYTGPAAVTDWLGEPKRGRRGQYRTSIDAAIFWIGRSKRTHATLAEWKYTESAFGGCRAFDSADESQRAACLSLDVAENPDPGRSCLLTAGGDYRSRRYWHHMETAGISLAAFAGIVGCPFQGPFYQLMRQYLVAAYLRQVGEADVAEVVCISFARNTKLHEVPQQLRPLLQAAEDDVIAAWNAVVDDAPPIRHWTAEDLMAPLRTDAGLDLGWRNYLRERYDV